VTQLEPERPGCGRFVDANLHLLDRQVLDRNSAPVTTVDDLELSEPVFGDDPGAGQPPVIIALLSGSVLGTRIFGGRPPRGRLQEIAWSHVTAIGTTLRLDVDADDLDLTWTERWVRDHIIAHIPGGRHDPQ
jgi:hypothetical protein